MKRKRKSVDKVNVYDELFDKPHNERLLFEVAPTNLTMKANKQAAEVSIQTACCSIDRPDQPDLSTFRTILI